MTERPGLGQKLLARYGLEFCILTFACCIWFLAYQLPLDHTLYVGGQAALQRREDDTPYLRGVNGSEPAERVDDPTAPRGYVWWWDEVERTGRPPYRWTTADSAVTLPGAGPGLYAVEIVARSGRPDEPAPTVWTVGGAPPVALNLPTGQPRRYRLLAPVGAAGELVVSMRTTPFAAPDDPRELGFVLHEVRLRAIGGGLRAPAWPILGWLALTVGVSYALARTLSVGRTAALAFAGAAALAATYTLVAHRPALTVFAPTLGVLTVCCAALGLAALPVVRRAAQAEAWRVEVGQVIALTLLAFALRLGGVLHPHALFSDLGFHANNLLRVTIGQVYLTAGLPDGGGQAPYPPGAYLMLLPAQLIADAAGSRRLLVQSGIALLDSLAVPLIWALLRRAGFGARAAALGAACYLLPTVALESFSVGEYANLGGQALALPLVALVGLGLAGTGAAPLWTAALVAAVAVAILSHSGVTLSVGAFTASLWALAWAARLRGRPAPVDPVRLTFAAGAALGTALLAYHSAPVYLELFAGREGGRGGVPLLTVLVDSARTLFGLTPPQGARVALPPLVGLAGLAGLGLVLRRSDPTSAPLRALLGAWWLGALVSLGLLVVAGQGVRWAIFLYPALCVGAGVALDALWRRGALGRAAAVVILAVILAGGMLAWIVQIRDYIHT